MPIATTVKAGLYKDSVALMRIAESLLARPGIRRATLVMGTPANRDILADAGLLAPAARSAQPTDLIVVIDGADDAANAAALAEAEKLLVPKVSASAQGAAEIPVRSIAMARERAPEARIAQISVPGPYAASEAMKALKSGLHVFLFSDNVPLAEECAIKVLAQSKGLLVMGPDCGTAIIAGVPLGFANVVRRGSIGLVAASGTGLQEVTTQIDALGGGISHAIGTGGRDVSAEVGGVTMLAGIDLLARDPATRVIGVISKPPAPQVAERVMAALAAADKPAVVLFLGASIASRGSIHTAATLAEAAATAVRLAGGAGRPPAIPPAAAALKSLAVRRAAGQQYIRALFSGGTYCSEAQAIWRSRGIATWSNVPLDKKLKLPDARVSREHTAVDLGEDEFTVGRPHPMIDMSTRTERLLAEANDPSTAVLLVDVVLGYGSHDDPAGALAPALQEARAIATRAGRELPVVAFVCGTEADPQNAFAQRAKLAAAGAIVAPSSAAAATLAADLAGR